MSGEEEKKDIRENNEENSEQSAQPLSNEEKNGETENKPEDNEKKPEKTKKEKRVKKKKTKRQKIGVAMMVTGSLMIVYFIWLNFYGTIYHEVYSFLYDRFWAGTMDENSVIFNVEEMPAWLIVGNELLPEANDEPVFAGENPYSQEDEAATEENAPTETSQSSQTETISTTEENISTQASEPPTAATTPAPTKKREPVLIDMPSCDSRADYKDNYMLLYVPRMGVYSWVQNGTDKKALGRGPGLYDISDLPSPIGTDANVLIAAHRNGTKANFYNMHKMKEGDWIYVYLDDYVYIYEYEDTEIVDDEDWSVTKRRGYSCLTLTSCHPIGDNAQRIVVYAKLIKVKPHPMYM